MKPVSRIPKAFRTLGSWGACLAFAFAFVRAQSPGGGDRPATVQLLFPLPESVVPADAVRFEAVAQDPDGPPLTRVEFLAGDTVVARSDRSGDIFPTVLGVRVAHRGLWVSAAPGVHTVRARAVADGRVVAESAPARVTVGGPILPPPGTDLPQVTVTASQPATAEPAPHIRIRPGAFTVTRKGDTRDPLRVFYAVGGTASNGRDYTLLDGEITLAAGESAREIPVMPHQDDLPEPDETIVLRLRPDPAYRVGEPAFATVTLHDTTASQAATLAFTSPRSGSVHTTPASIEFAVTALDPEGYIARIDFMAGGRTLGTSQITFIREPDPGTPIEHAWTWKDAPAGIHAITAVAADSHGRRVVSAPVTVLVRTPLTPPTPVLHPADIRPADNSISGDELEAYTARWRDGTQPAAVPVPVSHVTRAGFLWKAGGGYRFDPAAGPLPLAWVSATTGAEPVPGRDFLPPFQAGDELPLLGEIIPPRWRHPVALMEWAPIEGTGDDRLLLRTGPAPGTRSHALELRLHPGTAVADISDEGTFHETTATLRWGPFHDATPRRLTARVKSARPAPLRAIASFDGHDVPVVRIPSAPPSPGAGQDGPRIALVENLGNGGVQLVVIQDDPTSASAGSELEVSTDLVHWRRIARMPSGQDLAVEIDGDAETEVRFYRAVGRTP